MCGGSRGEQAQGVLGWGKHLVEIQLPQHGQVYDMVVVAVVRSVVGLQTAEAQRPLDPWPCCQVLLNGPGKYRLGVEDRLINRVVSDQQINVQINSI